MFVYKVKISTGAETEINKKKLQDEKDVEDSLDYLQNMVRQLKIAYDPVLYFRFLAEKSNIERNYDIGFRERMILNNLTTMAMSAKEKKEYEYRVIGSEDFYGIWFL